MVEVRTPLGIGYVQYIDRIPPYGALIRVLPGVRAAAATDVQAVADQEEAYRVFVPLGAALHRGILSIAGAASIPAAASTFRVMRNTAQHPRWEASVWWLWDGVREWRVGRDDPVVADASPKETWNDTLLIERIALGWVPRDDFDPDAHTRYRLRQLEFFDRFGEGPY